MVQEKIARNHDIYIVEDACQAFGASVDGIGAGAWGNLGCFSFYRPKNVVK